MSKPSNAIGHNGSIVHIPFALRTLSRLLNAMASPAQIADHDLIERLMRRTYAVTRLRFVVPDQTGPATANR